MIKDLSEYWEKWKKWQEKYYAKEIILTTDEFIILDNYIGFVGELLTDGIISIDKIPGIIIEKLV